jgi:PHD/YefM family antitoxin component YafN of YafNO toxin-antitoxin module
MSRKDISLKTVTGKKSRNKNSSAIAMVNKGGKTVVVTKNSPESSLVLVTT